MPAPTAVRRGLRGALADPPPPPYNAWSPPSVTAAQPPPSPAIPDDPARRTVWRSILPRALTRIELRLRATNALERVLLALATEPATDDLEAAAALAVELLRLQRHDGSWHADVFATTDALALLRALLPASLRVAAGAGKSMPALASAVRASCDGAVRARSWLAGLLGAPGSYGAGCTPARHAIGRCAHFLPALCSPGHADADLRGARLPDGTVFGSDAEARFCAAAAAARELALVPSAPRAARLQLGAIDTVMKEERLAERQALTPAACAAALTAFVMAAELAPAGAAERAAGRLSALQRADGTWPGGSRAALDALTDARHAGVDAARAALGRAAEHLAWTHTASNVRAQQPQDLWSAWRALRCETAQRADAGLELSGPSAR